MRLFVPSSRVTHPKAGTKTKQVPIRSVTYNAATAEVTLTPVKAIALKQIQSHRLTVDGDGTLADLAGNGFDGNADGAAGDDYVQFLSRAARRAASRSALLAAVDEVLAPWDESSIWWTAQERRRHSSAGDRPARE